MESSIIIENVSKQYRLGLVGTGTISHDLRRWWHIIRGKEDPYLKVGETNDRSLKGNSEYVWALKDINFEVRQGEVLGIIGKNGAGKSTLLKILSRVTAPTTGRIKYKGRISSLLEVGTGFHPELTGRENIYLNGAILGMRKKEIDSKFDEIVDFSGCERYIDTPVKRYSSGMTVRLGFSVAAFLEPEILVVDEVLAVGDAEFQKKALGKMQNVSMDHGRTVLFVSHNLGSIKNLCSRCALLEMGTIHSIGYTPEVIEQYLSSTMSLNTQTIVLKKQNNFANVSNVLILNDKNEPNVDIDTFEPFSINIKVEVLQRIPHFIVGVGIMTLDDIPLQTTFSEPTNIESGIYKFILVQDSIFLKPGKYKILIGLSSRERAIQYLDNIFYFNILNSTNDEALINSNGSFIINKNVIIVEKL